MRKMDELISIIVPVYNAETTLARCVAALRNQTYNRIEIILVNDGSSDGSLALCRKFETADPRIRVVDKVNGGVSSARNAGLDMARGELIMFCDSDDWAEPGWCEELITHYEPGHLLMCGTYIEGEQQFVPHEVKATSIQQYAKKDFHKLKLKMFNVPWNKIYASSVLRDHQLRFCSDLTNGEDYLFNLQYLSYIDGNIIFLDKCVFHYVWPREYSLSKKTPVDYDKQCCILSRRVFEISDGFSIDPQTKIGIATDFYNEFHKCICSILNNKQMPAREKISSMTKIMSSGEYQQCAAGAIISSNKIYTHLARQKHGLGLLLWHQILEVKRGKK